MDEQRDMSGALFREAENKSAKSPDYRGRIRVGGVMYRLSGWVRESKKDGRKFLSLAVSEETDQGPRREDAEVPF